MDLFASLFGLTFLVIGLLITYHWGIRPDRQEKKRRTERALADMRRQQYEKVRKQRASRSAAITHANSGAFPRGSS